MGWATGVLVAGTIVTLALLVRAIVGDRSRGRRRCPKCWYDMSATAGLVCPECGKYAKRETRLFKSRRRKRFIAASMLPLLVGVAAYGTWLARQPDWVKRTPSIVLVAASPWLDYSDRMMGEELLRRLPSYRTGDRMTDWERWLQGQISLRVARSSGEPLRVLLHTYLVVELEVQDDSTTAALLGLLADPDARVVARAVGFLGDMRPTEEVEIALVTLTEHPDRNVRDTVVRSLATLKREQPGGRPPELLFTDAADSSDGFRQALACRALGGFDPSSRSRAVLLKVTDTDVTSDREAPESAVVALTMHYPDDALVRGLLLWILGEPERGHGGSRCAIVERVLDDDRWFMDGAGDLVASRRALYSDQVRSAMIDALHARVEFPKYQLAVRERLRNHPCFTADERARIRGDERGDPGVPRTTK